MRVLVTGGAGFIGRSVVRRLLADGHEVTAAVRDPGPPLPGPVTAVRSDLSDRAELERHATGHDGLVHLAGSYRIGIRPAERPAMWEANVGATERVLDAAVAAGVGRIVHVSTVNAFGDTGGRVVDETYRRDPARGFLSWYDETKFRAHEVAERRAAGGAPVVIAMPGGTYGPGDHSAAGRMLEQAFLGRLRAILLGDSGLCWTHVDDVAAGLVAVLERGRVGEAYVLAGPPHRLRDAVAIAARAGGRRPPALDVPTAPLRLAARLLPLPGLREVLSASDGVTYWASSEKAGRELGWQPAPLEEGVRRAWA